MANDTKNYREHGGNVWVIGGKLVVTEDGQLLLPDVGGSGKFCQLTAEFMGLDDSDNEIWVLNPKAT